MLLSRSADVQAFDGRFLGKEDIILYGMQLTAEPAKQTVPKNIATIVSTYMQVPSLPQSQIPPLPDDAVVRATLRGPGLQNPIDMEVKANSPFTIPPLTVPGIYSLDNIRMVAGGEVLFYGTPESVTIEVIEKLLVTQVTARPLTAQEIRDKGIVFDKSNFQAYNFTAAFAVAPGREINISLPVVLPKLESTADVKVDGVAIPSIQGAQIASVATIIPDALKMAQTTVPNLSVQSFTLKPDIPEGNNFYLPPIPGVVVIPGDIGFLNQYFSVMLMVGNVAPADSNLVVKDIRAQIVLPPGRDDVVGTNDDPLRMAMTDRGESARIQPVAKPGPDGRLGTGDDIDELAPGETGNAEFLVEGRREGSHTVEMEITGTLYGLPIGPVPVRGRAMGTVLVRNPTFTMTFTHPDIVSAGERYTLDVTVTNTSESPANFVSINLAPRYVSGAELIGEPSRSIESILPGDSATVSFDLLAQVSGNVFAATLDSDEQIKGQFLLKTSVGELGIPLSPDSLVLPKEANALPTTLREAVIGMLGKAYATATAPSAALPKDVLRFGKKIVWDRAIEAAQAGFRYSMGVEQPDPANPPGEKLPEMASQLLMDFIGSNYSRINQLYQTDGERETARTDFTGFDDLRRRSVRGDTFAAAVAAILTSEQQVKGASTFHHDLASRLAYRPGFISILAQGEIGPLPVALTVTDASGRILGGVDANGKVTKQIPFSDLLRFNDTVSGENQGQLAILAAPDGGYTLRIEPLAGASSTTPYTLSIVYPTATGELRQLDWSGLTTATAPAFVPAADDPHPLAIVAAGTATPATASAAIADLPPSVISVVQQPKADVFKCDKKDPGKPLGRVVAMLFSEEVTAASVQDKLDAMLISNYAPEENRVVGVALQPGGRVAYVALRDPLGPFVPRTMTVANVADLRGHVMQSQTVPMLSTIEDFGGVVSGRILQADGSLVPGSEIRLVLQTMCPDSETWIDVGIAAKLTDANAHYQWDYVRGGAFRVKEIAMDNNTGDVRRLIFSLARHGQRLNADIVFLGRGTVQGRAFGEDGVTPLKDVHVKITNLVDQTEYGAITSDDGRYVIPRVPIGNSVLEAVHTPTNSHISQSIYIGAAGSVVEQDLLLLSEAVKKISVKYGQVSGTVLRPDGATTVANVPVVAWYQHNSQPGVLCPGNPAPSECAVAMVTTDANGTYSFASLVAGSHRLSSFDQGVYQEGEIRLILPADGSVTGNILLNGGFGTVRGTVRTADGLPVAGAQVGGGLVLASTDATGAFELQDVPVGHAKIVAVSQELGASGSSEIDIVRTGEIVNAAIVLSAVGGVYGTVYQAPDAVGTTEPAAGIDVYALRKNANGQMMIAGSAVTDSSGRYQIRPLEVMKLDEYVISAFAADLSDGNITKTRVLFNGHQAKADVTFKGSGRVSGTIFDNDGVTPLQARVSVSGLTVQRAKGPGDKMIGLGFVHTQHIRIIDTDFSSGHYSFDNVFVGPFVITAGGAFSPDPITAADVIAVAGETKVIDLKLVPTSVVSGRVMQPDGITPVGVAVAVEFTSSESKTFCTSNQTTGEESCQTIPQGIQSEIVHTLEDGTFLVPLVNAGSFSLTATDPVSGKTGTIKGWVGAGQTAEVTFRLLGQAAVTVRAIDSDGVTPIPGASVSLEQGEYPKQKKSGIADANGQITFNGIDEGPFTLLVRDMRNGFTGRGNGKVVKDGENVTVTVHLDNAVGTVYGTVYRPDGVTPVANADVAISNSAGPLAFNVTDSEGNYIQDTIPMGGVEVRVFEAATGRRGAGSGSVDLAGQRVPIIVTEAAVGHVRGKLYDSATMQVLRGWTVRLSVSFPDGSSISLVSTSGVDGSFFFPGIPQGEFTLFASRESLGSATAHGVIARENELVDIPILINLAKPARGAIEGVVLKQDGTAGADYQICIDPLDQGCSYNATTAADGTFAVADLALGRHLVIASAQGSASKGSALVDIPFSGSAAFVKLIVNTLSGVDATVVDRTNNPAAGVNVTLEKFPDAGCGSSSCTRATDQNGMVVFDGVPPGNYTIWAQDPVTSLYGAVSGTLIADTRTAPRIVLEINGTVTGSVLYPDQQQRAGIIVELRDTANSANIYFTATDGSGAFVLRGVKAGNYQLDLTDPLGTGIAQRFLTVNGAEDVGTIILDDAPPSVRAVTPMPGSVKVPLAQAIAITFSESIKPGSVTDGSLTLSDGKDTVSGTLAIGSDTVTFTPISALKEQTLYTLKVSGITDNFSRPMDKVFIATFTTVDLTPPAVLTLSPEPSTSGAPLESVIRVTYNEPVDPAAFSGPAIALTLGSVAIEGRVDMIYGNTGAVFTPKYPLAEGSLYHVAIQPATDLSGNRQIIGREFDFTSTDRMPPSIQGLNRSNGGAVIENGIATVDVNVGTASDVAFVDFYINDVMANTDRTAPFALSFQAVTSYGPPGTLIKVGAIATDTSGNRGPLSETLFTIVADTPPTVAITAPAAGNSFRTGERVNVTVTSTDDLAVTRVGYQAMGGQAPATLTTDIVPQAAVTTQNFAFYVPADAVPGSTITIKATAVDSKGQSTAALPVEITVLDATAPVVSFTGLSSGQKVNPGQAITAVAAASDLGKIARLDFAVAGATVYSESRVITPPLASIGGTFSFTVSPAASAGETVDLTITAYDVAGNHAMAGPVKLPVADVRPPTVTALRLSDNATEIAPNQQISVIAEASDEIGIQSISLSGSGAFEYPARSQGISPPLGSATGQFTVTVPSNVPDGAVLQLAATATDTSNNTSQPRVLNLTVRSTLGVTLPSSQVINAGDARTLELTLTAPAPAGGLRVDLLSADSGIVTVSSPLEFAAGEQVRSFTINAIRGGTTQINAAIAGATAATMSVAVNGGIVTGVVYNPYPTVVAGAEVVVNGFSQTTGADGTFAFNGIAGPGVTIRVNDPVSKLRGYASASMNASYGYLKNVQIQLVPAGAIHGEVRRADATTPAGENVLVELFAASDLNNRIDAVFTDQNSLFDFPLVPAGSYVIQVSNGAGEKGRANASIIQSGQELSTLVLFLGKGSVKVTVFDGSDNTVPNADLTFTSRHLFGSSTQVVTAGSDGSYTFTDVFLGDFFASARDQVTGFGAGGSGILATNGQLVSLNLRLAAYASIEGHVYRADGTTPAGGVKVSAGSSTTTTDPDGFYRIEILPLGIYTIFANDAAARSKGQGSVALQENGTTMTVNLTLSGQGSVVAAVVDDYDQPVINAAVTLNDGYGSLIETTDSSGNAVFNKVMAGSVSATARGLGLIASASGTVATGATTTLAIKLQSVHVDLGSIRGTVFAPDGLTPLEGMRVDLRGVSVNEYRTATSASDGSYRFDDLQMGSYNLFFYDETNQLRAKKLAVVLLLDQQVETADGVFVGIGTVSGRVLKNGSVSAGGVRTTVQSLNPEYGRTFTAITDPAGYYLVERVPVGQFAVTASDVANQMLGEAFGQLQSHGEVATADVIMLSNAFNPPRTLNDGNLYRYDIQTDATLASGNSVFSGAGILEIGTTRFTGDAIGTQEDQSRELAIRQLAVAGLNVTRKVFVPRDGYFARYLEILSNPTAADITVDLKVRTNMAASFGTITTSTGDATVSAEDQWATFDDGNATAPPAVALVWGGSLLPTDAAFATGSPAVMTTTWGNLTVPAGQTVALMHFVVQQNSRDAAKLAAERLVQLPPEALSGLSYDEIAAIRNFAIPADGSSLIPTLPAMATEVTGQVLASDGITAAGSGATVWLTSSQPLFAKTWQTSTDSSGRFRFATDYSNMVFPIADFSLSGRVWRNAAVDSPTVNGSFEAGRSSASSDIVFSNTGIIHGTVTDAAGLPFGSTYFSLTQGSWQASVTTPVDGSYRFVFMPAGTYAAYASASSAQGSSATATGTATVVASVDTVYDLAFPAQGTVVGTASLSNGNPAVNAAVRLSSGSFVRTTTTGANGMFSLFNVPVGSYTLTVTEPVTGLTTSVTVTVSAGATASPNVVFPVSGKVTGSVVFADGSSGVSGASMQFFDAAGGSALRTVTTGSTGGYDSGYFSTTAASLLVRGTYTYATASGNRSVSAEQTVAGFTDAAQTVTADLTIPVNRAAIRTVVRMSNGVLMTGDTIRVEARYPDSSLAAYCNTSATTGECTMSNVVADAAGVRVRAVISATSLQEQTVIFSASNTTATVDLTLPIDPVTLPKTLYDGNAAPYDIQTDGTVRTGLNGLFTTATKGGAALEIISGTTVTPFAGGLISVMEDQGREFLVRQDNLAGLSVGRKVFVPKDGYFTRYLELLSNPTDTAITVGVRVRSNFTGNNSVANIIATSSQATALSGSDSWVAFDDEILDDPYVVPTGNLPPAAFIWQGAGNLTSADAAFDVGLGLTTTWNTITIQPGQTVALLHFVSQQSSRAGALASAERLAQLPPEAIAGMNPFEMAEVMNFAVPVDGSSTLAALPPLNGSVTGRVTADDGTTPAPNGSTVLFKSNNLYYGRTYQGMTGMNGAYAFGTNLINSADSVGIVRDSFTVQAKVAMGAPVLSPVAEGDFTMPAAGLPPLVYDLQGDINGLTRNPNGQWRYGSTPAAGGVFTLLPYPSASIGLVSYNLYSNAPPSVTYNGTAARITSASQFWDPGDVTFHPGQNGDRCVLRWTAPLGGTFGLSVSFDAHDTRPTTTDVHLILNGTDIYSQYVNSYPGTVSYAGTVTVAAGDTIDLAVGRGTNNDYSYDTTGVTATYTLQALAADTAVVDISFTNTGRVSGTAYMAGSGVADASVTLTGGAYTTQAVTPADGSYIFRFLPPGEYALAAVKSHPQGSSYSATATAVVAAGAVTQQDLQFPGIGTLTGTVTNGGTAIARALVTATATDFSRATYSGVVVNGISSFTFDGLPVGTYSIIAYSPTNGVASAPQNVTIVAGVNSPLAIDIPATGTGLKVWDGGANTTNWTDGSNWSGNTVPTATDDVYIPSGVTVNYNTTVTVHSIAGDGTLNLNGGTLTPSQPSGIKTLNLAGATLMVNSPATMTVQTYNQTSGTLNGSGNLVVNGMLTFNGGNMYGSGETIANGGAVFGAGTDKWIRYSRRFTNNGIVTVKSTVYFYTDSGVLPVFTNPAGSVIDFVVDVGLDYNSSTWTLNNAGIIRKSAGSGTAWMSATLNNSGRLEVTSGQLDLWGAGGTTTGTVTVAQGATLSYRNGTHNLDAGSTISGSGRILVQSVSGTPTVNVNGEYSAFRTDITGGTLNFNSMTPTTVQLNLSGGNLGGNGRITVSGPFTFSGGTMRGNGETVANGGILFTAGADKWIRYGTRTLTNNGTATVASTVYFYTDSGALPIFNNPAGSVINFVADVGLDYNSSTWTLNNSGTVRKSAGTGTAWMSGTQNNSGRFEVLSGQFDLWGPGGTTTGTVAVAQGATLSYRNGTHNLNTGSMVSGSGRILVQAVSGTPTVNVNDGYTVSRTDITGGTLNFNSAAATTTTLNLSGGTLGGTGTIAVSGLFTFTGGNMYGTGETIANGGIVFDGTGAKWIRYGRTLTNNGTATFRATVNIDGYGGATTVNNPAGSVLDFVTDFGFGYNSSGWTLNNAGTIRKSAGTGESGIDAAPFNHSGRLEVLSGQFNIWGSGGSETGIFTAAQGATLSFRTGTHTLAAGSSVSGDGRLLVQALSGTPTVNVNGEYTIANTALTGGYLNFQAPTSTTQSFTMSGGQLSGSGGITTPSFTWSGGTIGYGTGTLTIPAGGTMALTGATADMWLRDNYSIVNNGTVTHSGTRNLLMYNNATFVNGTGAVYDFRSDVGLDYYGGTTTLFTNRGTLRKSAGTGASWFDTSLVNDGIIDIQTGQLHVWNNLTTTAGVTGTAINGGADTLLSFRGGTSTIPASCPINVPNVEFYNGTTTVLGSFLPTTVSVLNGTHTLNNGAAHTWTSLAQSNGTFTLGTNVTVAAGSITQSNGTLGGTGSITTPSFTWSGGTIGYGTGTLTIPAGGTMALTGATADMWLRDNYSIVNNGTVTHSGTRNLIMYNNATFLNGTGAVYDFRSDVGLDYYGGTMTLFTNRGTLRKSAGTGASWFDTSLVNDGIIDIQTGQLHVWNNLTTTAGVTGTAINGGADTLLSFRGGTSTIPASCPINVPSVEFYNGTTTVLGSFLPTTVSVLNGTHTLNNGVPHTWTNLTQSNGTFALGTNVMVAAGSITQSNGTLSSSGSITTPSFTWSGGTLAGTGSLTIPAGGVVTISGTTQKWLRDGFTLNNGGTATMSGTGYLYFYTGTLNNLASGLIDITSDVGFTYSNGIFNNAGTLRKSGGTGTTSLDATTITNSGTIELQSGSMSANQGITQVAGSILLNGRTLGVGGSGLVLNGGSLTGPGTLSGNVTNAGVITTAGVLNVSGNYSQTASATLSTAIGSLAAYDQLRVTGAVTLAGTLGLSWNGFIPAMTDTFDVVTYGSLTGTFGRVTGNHVGGNAFHASYPAGKVTLVGSALTFIGTVQGVVSDADGLTLVGATVEATDSATGLILASVPTGSDGSYRIADLDPSAAFVITVKHPANPAVTVSRSFSFSATGEVIVCDVTMPGLPITLPQYLYDANGLTFDVQNNGTISGTSSLFYQNDGSRGGSMLMFGATQFAGGGQATSEASGREYAVRQDGIAGLNVQRKVFVPQDGYFARYLEIFSNPGAAPVTVDLSVVSKFYYYYAYVTPITTSSGDALLQPGSSVDGGDTWAVFDDESDVDPFVTSNRPASAFVWSGTGTGINSPAMLTATGYANYSNPASLSVGYGQITVQPGESIALMHFLVQQTSRAAAQASAERLVQLPPEALAFITPAERAMIRNFVVPPVSTLAPLPALNGTVTANVVAGDGTTPVSNVSVNFRSTLPYFQRSFTVTSNAQGQATLTSATSRPVPLADYNLNASLSLFGATVNAPQVTGSFVPGSNSSTATVTFTGTGRLNVRVLRSDGVTGYPGLTVMAANATNSQQTLVDLGNGNYVLPVAPAGDYTVSADISPVLSSGNAYRVSSPVTTLASGETRAIELTVPPLGSISGILRSQSGTPVTGYYFQVNLQGLNTGLSRYYYTYYSSTGYFMLDNLPADTYRITYAGNGTHTYDLVLAPGQNLVQDLTLHTVGNIMGTVYLADGVTPFTSAYTYLQVIDAITGLSIASNSTNWSTGTYTLSNIATDNSMTLRASYTYAGRDLVVDQFIPPFTSNGQTVTQNVLLPLNRVNLQVSLVDTFGNPLSIYYVPAYIYDVTSGNYVTSASMYYGSTTFNGVLVGSDGVRVDIVYAGTTYSRTVTASASNVTLPVIITIPLVSGTVSGGVYAADGSTAVPGASVYVYDSLMNYLGSTSTDATGSYTIANLNVTSDAILTLRPSYDGVSQDYPFSFASGSTATVDAMLPLSVVRGTVYHYDGMTVVPWPTVIAQQTVDSGEGPYTRSYYGTSDEAGQYVVLGVQAGEFTVTANDSNTGLAGQSSVQTLYDLASPVTVDISLGPSGTVAGLVVDDGSPVSGATVYLTSLATGFTRNAATGAGGTYQFDMVPAGDFSVQAELSPRMSASMTGTVNGEGDVVTMADLTIPPFATVQGYLYDNLGQPLPGVSVRIYNSTTGQSVYLVSDSAGFYRTTSITAGAITVSASYNNWTGSANGTVEAGSTLAIDCSLTSFNLGSGYNIYSSVTDAVQTTNYLFDIRNGGYLSDGGAQNPSLSDAYDGAYYLSVNGSQFSSSVAAFELDNRQIVIGPQAIGALNVVRKLYAPTTGGYVRYLDMVTNSDLAASATVSLNVFGNLGSDSGTMIFRGPADSGDTYAVTYESWRSDPSLAHVYASVSGQKPSARQFAAQNDSIYYTWGSVLIPPGETRCLLHFAVQRKTYDEAVAETQAQSLVNFTDPHMLDGLTAGELGCIINFVQ